MANSVDEPPGLQFDKVEPVNDSVGGAEGRFCSLCRRPITDEYFELGGQLACPSCANQKFGQKGGAGPVLRAAAFGGAAALAGTIAWFLIVKITNYELGLIAVGVGLLVGVAVRRGSRGRGGWKYQVLAMLLTYSSITISKVPFIVQAIADRSHSATEKSADKANTSPEATGDKEAKHAATGGEIVFAFLWLIGIALASPFLGGAENFMGIIIIGIALYEAWKMNKRVPLSGPFRLGATPAVAAAAASGGAPQPPSP